MPADDVTPEDRQKIAKMTFKEWFDECYNERFGGDFDSRLNDCFAAAGGPPSPTPHQQPTAHQQPKRRGSLFDMALRDALNL